MAAVVPFAIKALVGGIVGKKIGPKGGGGGVGSGLGAAAISGGAAILAGKAARPRNVPAQVAPAEPNIDDAAKNSAEVDRIKRRRGVLGNIFGGSSAVGTSPTVGTKQLLGQ